MNAVIIFTIVFLGGGCSADINRRDGSTIVNVWGPQIETASFYSGQHLTPSCVQTDCPVSKINSGQCSSFCSPNAAKFQAMFNSMNSCYKQPLCGFNLQNQTLNNVYQPLNVSGYSGTCVLSGPTVTVTSPLQPVTSAVTSANQSSTVVGYVVNTIANSQWQGLVINCSSNANPNTVRSAFVQKVGCFIFGNFNSVLNLLNLNCNSGVASNSFSGNVAFQSNVAFQNFYTIDKNLTANGHLISSACDATISNLVGAVPANLVPAVTLAIQTLFNGSDFQFMYTGSIYNTDTQLFANTIAQACTQTKCTA